MELTIRINLDNAAIHENMEGELKKIMDSLIEAVVGSAEIGRIYDSNGYKVGHYVVEE